MIFCNHIPAPTVRCLLQIETNSWYSGNPHDPWSTRQGTLSMLAKTAVASWVLHAFSFQGALFKRFVETHAILFAKLCFQANLNFLNHQVQEQRGAQELAAEKGAWCCNEVHGWDPRQCSWECTRLRRGGEIEFCYSLVVSMYIFYDLTAQEYLQTHLRKHKIESAQAPSVFLTVW